MTKTKPDSEAYAAQSELLTAQITVLKAKLDNAAAKIASADTTNPHSDARSKARAAFDALLKQKTALAGRKTDAFETQKTLSAAFKKKNDEIKKNKDKIGYKSSHEVLAQITSLELQLKNGGITLMNEKRIVAEISNLCKIKKTLDSFVQPASIEDDRTKLDNIRASIKALDDEMNFISVKLDAAKADLTALDVLVNSGKSVIDSLFSSKKAVFAELSALKEQKTSLYRDFKANQEEYYAYQREVTKIKEEQRKQEMNANRERKLLERAEFELENAAVPAFAEEISTCIAISTYLLGVLGEKPAVVEREKLHGETFGAPLAARIVNVSDSQPAGSTVVPSKKDNDDAYMVMGASKNKKKQKPKNEDAKVLRIDLEMINQFSKLQINAPTTIGQIRATLAELENKRVGLMNGQADQTAKNKKDALKRVEKLREAANKGEENEELSEAVEV